MPNKRSATTTSMPTMEESLHDPLLELLHRMESLCEAMGFLVFKGYLLSDEEHEVMWNVERDAEPEHFLALAKNLGVRLLYVDGPAFSEEMIEDAWNDAEPQDQRLIAEFRSHVGRVRYVDAAFCHDQMFHRYRVVPDWYDSFLQVTEIIDNEHDE